MATDAIAFECGRLFESLLQLPATDDLKHDWESVVFRFNIWCHNNLSFSRTLWGWFLRDAPLLESAVVEVLDELKRDLIQLTALCVSESRILFPPGDICYPLNRLWRLSRAIRRSGVFHGFLGFADCIEYDSNGLNLTEEFRKGVKAWVESRLNSSTASENVKRRVFDTICLRQEYFAYLRVQNETKKPTSHSYDFTASMVSGSSSDTASLKASQASSSRTVPAKKSPRGSESDIPSMASTSTPPERERHIHSLKSASGIDADESSCIVASLPPPPNIENPWILPWCPYCFSHVPELRNFVDVEWKWKWKRHILQDLMPFVCVLEPCLTPTKLYESEQDWVNHMKTQHGIGCWTCMDSTHGKSLIFHEEIEFRSHMQDCHFDQFDFEELDDLVAACYQTLPREVVISKCPFCAETEDHSGKVNMIKHVTGHLLAFALLSWEGRDPRAYLHKQRG